jgi:hypothetical protein
MESPCKFAYHHTPPGHVVASRAGAAGVRWTPGAPRSAVSASEWRRCLLGWSRLDVVVSGSGTLLMARSFRPFACHRAASDGDDVSSRRLVYIITSRKPRAPARASNHLHVLHKKAPTVPQKKKKAPTGHIEK